MSDLLNQIAQIVAAKSLAKVDADIAPGQYDLDVTFQVRVRGSVKRAPDKDYKPTTSVPLLSVLALCLQKSGVTRERSMEILRESLTDAMVHGKDKDKELAKHVKGMEAVIEIVQDEILSQLPRPIRKGRLTPKCDVDVTILEPAAAEDAATV